MKVSDLKTLLDKAYCEGWMALARRPDANGNVRDGSMTVEAFNEKTMCLDKLLIELIADHEA